MSILITFEGIEGCGKSSQAKLLAEFLQAQCHSVFLTREPGGPPISEDIRKILLDKHNKEMKPVTEVLLYSASRSQHTLEWIKPALEAGKIVICDRYYDSTYAYQGVARNIDMESVEYLTRFATGGLEPDITFLIDLPAETGLSRIHTDSADRLELEDLDFHQRVRNGFLSVAKRFPRRYIIINGKGTIDEIFVEITKSLEQHPKFRSFTEKD
ncbi:MAG: dTMP kinase [Candidatus Cloacimonetes bacterium]|nr:dTMP kinase [Candidatus Cloacimonadota bacterium]